MQTCMPIRILHDSIMCVCVSKQTNNNQNSTKKNTKRKNTKITQYTQENPKTHKTKLLYKQLYKHEQPQQYNIF